MKTSVQDRRHLARLVRLLRQCVAQRPRRVLLEEAEIELWGLYRREQAQLLAEAAALRANPDGVGTRELPGARAGSRPDALVVADRARREARRAALRAWRARARECAALVAYDGYPLAEALRDCLALPLHAWDSAPELGARAARLAVDPPAADRN